MGALSVSFGDFAMNAQIQPASEAVSRQQLAERALGHTAHLEGLLERKEATQ